MTRDPHCDGCKADDKLRALRRERDELQARLDALDAAMKRVRAVLHEIEAEAQPEPPWHVEDQSAEAARCNALRWAVAKVSIASRVGPDPWVSPETTP